jgi:hypothetical protein
MYKCHRGRERERERERERCREYRYILSVYNESTYAYQKYI